MNEQSFKNHRKYVPLFHFVASTIIVLGFIAAIINLVRTFDNGSGRLTAALLLAIFITFGLFFWFIRSFSLGAQNRAIRAEENLRYFSMTGKLLDSRLRLGQIIALRFAPDDELLELAEKAVRENLQPADIKQAIQNWKADHHRI